MANVNLLKGNALAFIQGLIDAERARAEAAEAALAAANFPVPVGTIFPFGGVSAPANYLLAYGQEISRSTYAALFSVFGTRYGAGNGSTTFNLPDLRDRAVFGTGAMGGEDANRVSNYPTTLAASGGVSQHKLELNEIPAHKHGISMSTAGAHQHTISPIAEGGVGGDNVQGWYPRTGTLATSTAGAHTHTVTMDNAGGGDGHNNMPPFIVLNYIIRVR